MAEPDTTQTVQTVVENLLSHLGIEGTITVTSQDQYVTVHLDVEETGILIGYHGETLASLQMVIAQIVFHQLGSWVHISVDVGDYQQKRVEHLEQMADRIVDEVIQRQTSVSFPFLNARERRIIHMYLQEHEQVRTESVGEDQQRRLVVFPA